MKVLVIDDHALFRKGLQSLLEMRGIEVVAAVGNAAEGLGKVHEVSPDVILLDVRMPDMNGLQALRRLREEDCRIPVVMLTTSSEQQDLKDSLRHGVQGYLLKDMEPDDLVVALRNIVDGKTVVAPQLAGTLAEIVQGEERAPAPPEASPFDELTPREREILSHVSEGQTNKVIARHLDISDGTVKLHVKSILRKLGVHSRVAAAVIAVERGFSHKV